MFIKCWGSRGSIPVSGPDYLRYGGDTTCIEVRSSRGDVLVIDAGSGVRRLGEKLLREGVKSLDLLFTHAHLDHIMGVPFFAPIYQKGVSITVHGKVFDGSGTYRDILKGVMRGPYCPVELEQVDANLTFLSVDERPLKIGSLTVRSIPLSHPNGGLGYRIEEGRASFVFLTDNELDYMHATGRPDQDYVDFSRGADLLIHDAEYTEKDYSRAWGHSVYTSAVKMGLAAGARRFGLFHINQRRTDDEMDAMVAQSRQIVTEAGGSMSCFGVSAGWEIVLG